MHVPIMHHDFIVLYSPGYFKFNNLDYVFNDRDTRDFQSSNNGKTQMESNRRDSFGFGGAFSKFDTNDQASEI